MLETTEIAAPAPSEGAPLALSTPATLFGIFVKPRATFEALTARPRILAAILVLLLAQVVVGYLLIRSGVVRNDAIEQLEAKGTAPEQIAATEAFLDSPAMYVLGILGPVVAVGFMVLVSAALLYFMANLILGARLRYREYVCIATYSALISVVDQVVRTLLGMSRGTLHVMLGVGAFFGEAPGFGLRLLDSLTSPLLLWATAIEALGVSVFARKGFGFGVLSVLPGFVVLLLLSSTRQ